MKKETAALKEGKRRTMSKTLRDDYVDIVMLFERLHRLFLEVLKSEIDRLGLKDLSNVQAIILYNVGPFELTVGEITNRGYYLGSNVSYNLRKMVENNYIVQKQSPNDKRSTYISLSPKGKKVYAEIESLLEKQAKSLSSNQLSSDGIKTFLENGRALENFWSHELLHKARFVSL